jgi:hypothetical protein
VLEAYARHAGLGLGPRQLQHLLGEVDADHLAPRGDAVGQLEREIARAGGDIERASARRELGEVGGAPAPRMVQAGGHDRVHPVIETGDPVEHRPDLWVV